jgi:WhiB family transcriptional regulator, redox-sensing transcriptional regulator
MEDWTMLAACDGHDPELWFPLDDGAQARAVCAGCPVKGDCLRFALDGGLDHGIFGGLDASQRRELKMAH